MIKIGRNYIFECSDYIDESVSLGGMYGRL